MSAAARGDAGTSGGSTRRRTTIASTTPTCRAWRASSTSSTPTSRCLQELVDARQLDEIVARLSRSRAPYRGRAGGALRLRSARGGARARRSTRPRSSSARSAVDTARASCIGHVRRSATGGARAAISAHFDVFDPARRAEQADELARARRGSRRDVVFAGGDFNLDPAWAARHRQRGRRRHVHAIDPRRSPTPGATPGQRCSACCASIICWCAARGAGSRACRRDGSRSAIITRSCWTSTSILDVASAV